MDTFYIAIPFGNKDMFYLGDLEKEHSIKINELQLFTSIDYIVSDFKKELYTIYCNEYMDYNYDDFIESSYSEINLKYKINKFNNIELYKINNKLYLYENSDLKSPIKPEKICSISWNGGWYFGIDIMIFNVNKIVPNFSWDIIIKKINQTLNISLCKNIVNIINKYISPWLNI